MPDFPRGQDHSESLGGSRSKLKGTLRRDIVEDFSEPGIARDRRGPPSQHSTLIFLQSWQRVSLRALE
jgi:hypothetical protein